MIDDEDMSLYGSHLPPIQTMIRNQQNTNIPCLDLLHEEADMQDIHIDMDFSDPEDCSPKTYTNLESSPMKPDSMMDTSYKFQKDLHISKNNNLMMRWTLSHPSNWGPEEVLDWLFYVFDLLPTLDVSNFKGNAFNKLTGADLCRMTRDQFLSYDPIHGNLLYAMFRDIVQKSQFILTEPVHDHLCEDYDIEVNSPADFNFYQNNVSWDAALLNNTVHEDQVPQVTTTCSSPPSSCPSTTPSPPPCAIPMNGGYTERHPFIYNDVMVSDANIPTSTTTPVKPAKRRPGRPPKNPQDPTKPRPKGTRGRKPGQVAKNGNHLWEFMRDLLKNPDHLNKIIKWENRKSGVFRIIQSEIVAKKWGQKKHNENMTYEKLSRAMRFCRSEGYFDSLPKDGKYPKKLCFRFGTKSFGWQED